MNFWKNPKFWIVVGVALIPLTLVAVGFLGRSSKEPEEKTETIVPAVVRETTNATSSATPQSVTIKSQKLAKNYFVYEKSEYEKARSANRPIFLFFYANWCPTCEVQEPITVATLNSLTNSNVIGFRVNYNDSDTSSDEEILAKEFGVRYQHTMFTLDNTGKQIDKFLGETSEDQLKEAFAKVN